MIEYRGYTIEKSDYPHPKYKYQYMPIDYDGEDVEHCETIDDCKIEIDEKEDEFMDTLRIGFDVDGVFADFHLMASLSMKGELVRTSSFLEPWIGAFYKGIKKEPSFWERMPTINENTLEGIRPECFITTIEPEMISFRKRWLTNKIKADANIPVYASSDKLDIIDKKGLDYFVDDNPALIKEILESGIKCTPIQIMPYYADYEVVDERLLVRSVKEFKTKFLYSRK